MNDLNKETSKIDVKVDVAEAFGNIRGTILDYFIPARRILRNGQQLGLFSTGQVSI